jgi:hypothetical protein
MILKTIPRQFTQVLSHNIHSPFKGKWYIGQFDKHLFVPGNLYLFIGHIAEHDPSNYEQFESEELPLESTGQVLFGVNKSVPLHEVHFVNPIVVQVLQVISQLSQLKIASFGHKLFNLIKIKIKNMLSFNLY